MPVHPDISIRGGLRQRRKKCLREREELGITPAISETNWRKDLSFYQTSSHQSPNLLACAPACSIYAMPLAQSTTQLVNLNLLILPFRPA